MAQGEQQREPAADAKPDDPGLARAALLAGQPGPHRVDVIEGPPPPGAQVAADGQQTPHRPAPVEQVGRHGQVTLARQPVGLVAQVLAHAPRVVDDHNPGHGPPREGTARYAGTRPRALETVTSAITSPQSPGPDGSEHMPKGALIAGSGTHRTPGSGAALARRIRRSARTRRPPGRPSKSRSVIAATEPTSGRRRPLADGVLHAYCLGCLRDPESRAAGPGSPSRKSVAVDHRSMPR